ncbi:MAG TPA: tetratricopeptide repeat protein [Gammaproteobacteria bacterium]|nr:tetratricopeptide repeat protein [Gammaproteobacteria bacterium]
MFDNDWRKILTVYYGQHFGPIGIWLSFAIISIVGIWWQWGHIKALPGVAQMIEWLEKKPLPEADTESYTIAVAQLGNDDQDVMRGLIVDELRNFGGIAILEIPEAVTADAAESNKQIQDGHNRARDLLKKTGANVMLWGEVIKHDNQTRPRLYWTTSLTTGPHVTGRYEVKDFSFPEVFWNDLKEVLSLVIATQAAEVDRLKGRYIADRLTPFIDRLERLVSEPRWNETELAKLQLILANSYSTIGEQAGRSEHLERAVVLFRKVMSIYIREQAPLDWAATQNNLGNALRILGERESGTVRLEEAIRVYESTLEVLREARANYYIVQTENNLIGVRKLLTARQIK